MLSMAFRCVRDLRSQDQLVDSKMMVESKTVAFVTLLMVWQRIECSQSRKMKKSRPCTMNYIIKLTSLYFVGVVMESTTVLFLFRGAQIGDNAFLHLICRSLVVSCRFWF